jgi:hypothetical protein
MLLDAGNGFAKPGALGGERVASDFATRHTRPDLAPEREDCPIKGILFFLWRSVSRKEVKHAFLERSLACTGEQRMTES